MKDSILKGTGNSRFLKSAIPDGTTWAEALAMLRAGTFPMDLNGINNAGFQQVGTTLNKANLLKDVNALTLGLTGDVVPDDMFNVLAHAGGLHVWRKTVTTAQEIPAGYTLGNTIASLKVAEAFTVSRQFTVKVAASISVDDAGTITLNNPTSSEYGFEVSAPEYLGPQVAGKFVQFSSTGDNIEVVAGTWFFETTASASFSNRTYYVTKAKPVNAHGIIPAGTTATYPVSTNRNAYHEGDDAKPAGYTLGATQKNVQILSGGDNWHTTLYYADSVVVDDEGKLSLQSPNSYTFVTSSQYQNVSTFAIGRFIKIVPESGSGFSFMDGIWFVPSDSTITVENFKLYASKIQPVTGYAATPANTTIEYLGCLGDKTMVQVVSYVGTGTYGSSNPNSLTFDFSPKLIMVRNNGAGTRFLEAIYGMELAVVNYSSGGYVSMIWNKKTVSWYSTADPRYQMNLNGTKYYAVAIG